MVPVTLLQRAALALLPLSLLAACTTPAGQQQPASDLLPASYAHSAGGSAAVIQSDSGWRDVFTDPGLQALIEQALDNNRDLRTAVLRVQEAQALYGIQRSEQIPSRSPAWA